jgi:hypothetical protein
MAVPANSFPTTAALSAQDTSLWNDFSMAQTYVSDHPRMWQLQKTSTDTLGPDVLSANPTGRWLAMEAKIAGGTYVDVDLAFAPGDTSKSATVAAAWYTAGTSLSWAVQSTVSKTPEEAALEGFRVAFQNLVDGVGFDIVGVTDGPSTGTFRVRVTGVRVEVSA